MPKRVAVALRNSKAVEVCRSARESALSRRISKQGPTSEGKKPQSARASRQSSGASTTARDTHAPRASRASALRKMSGVKGAVGATGVAGESNARLTSIRGSRDESTSRPSSTTYQPQTLAEAAADAGVANPSAANPSVRPGTARSDVPPPRGHSIESASPSSSMAPVQKPSSAISHRSASTVSSTPAAKHATIIPTKHPRRSSNLAGGTSSAVTATAGRAQLERTLMRPLTIPLKGMSITSMKPRGSLATRTSLNLGDSLRTARPSSIPRAGGRPRNSGVGPLT